LINKVNSPPKIALLQESKSMEHDPGASSGSGLAYERPPEKHEEKNQDPEDERKKPKLYIVSELEKSGMTEVVLNFYEHKNNDPAPQSAGLTTKRYSVDSSRSKGLLLNKKAE